MKNKFSSEKYLCIWNDGGERNQEKYKMKENTLTSMLSVSQPLLGDK
jgi:hypothetical protein